MKIIRSTIVDEKEYVISKDDNNFFLCQYDKKHVRKMRFWYWARSISMGSAAALGFILLPVTEHESVEALGASFLSVVSSVAFLVNFLIGSAKSRWFYSDKSGDYLKEDYDKLFSEYTDYVKSYITSLSDGEFNKFVKNNIHLKSFEKVFSQLDKILDNDSINEITRNTAQEKKDELMKISQVAEQDEKNRIEKVKAFMDNLDADKVLEDFKNPQDLILTQ